MTKLALGTVQFGLNYGIKNKTGRVTQEEAFRILDAAAKNGIDTLDTAAAYGESESVLGNYLKNRHSSFKIISKLPAKVEGNIKPLFEESLKKLGRESVYGYLFHDYNTYRLNPGIWEALKELKSSGKIKKIGFSFYFPKDLEEALEKQAVPDLVQVPYNLFDRRFEPLFPVLKERNIEVHVRSVFLQGLLLSDKADLKPFFKSLFPKLDLIKKLSDDWKMTPSSLCLNFALANELIDRVVIGVDSLENLGENLRHAGATDKIAGNLAKLEILREEDENIILPFNWK